MPKNKRCMYSLCLNNSDPAKPRVTYPNFIPFPRPRKDLDKCKQWILACGRFDNQLDIEKIAKKSYYICEEHFIGGKGPTPENPNPVQFQETSETLKLMNQSWPSLNEEHCQSLNTKSVECTSSECLEVKDGVKSKEIMEYDNVICISEEDISISKEGQISSSASLNGTFSDKYYSENHADQESVLNSTMIINSSNVNSVHFESSFHDNVMEFSKQVSSQTLAGKCIPKNWVLVTVDGGIALTIQNIEKGLITKSYVLKDCEASGILKINGKIIPENHPLVKSLPEITSVDALFKLLDAVNSFPLCTGIIQEELQKHFATKEKTAGYINKFDEAVHSIACNIVLSQHKKQNKINLETKDLCEPCTKYRRVLINSIIRQRKSNSTKHGERRNCYLPRDKLIKKLKTKSQRVIDHRKRIKKIKSKIKKDSKLCGQYFHDKDSKFIADKLEEQKKSLPKNSFKRLFVEQQLAIMRTKTKRQRRWHPKIIKWAIHLHKKSSSAYNAMLTSGIFELPSKRTLYNHSSHVGLNSGFREESLIQATEMFNKACPEEHQKFVSVILDEMKIKDDIIYRASTGELVGFSNLDDTGNEILKIRNQGDDLPEVATHVLQVMIRSITGNFKYPLAYFPCKDMNSDSLHRIISEAISKLEFNGIKVLSVIGDGASTNRKMFQNFVQDGFRWKNIYACDEDRYIYFICDPPHLLKTARNGVSNSNFHTKTKHLIKNGQPILWTHLLNLYDLDYQRTVKLVPKLTRDHLFLDSHSRMRVGLAAQVFSEAVANALEFEFGDVCRETVKLIRLMNKFFDCMNSRNFKEGILKRNPNLAPFSNENDERLKWLEGPFLQYFEEWQMEVDRLPKTVKAADRNKMSLSRETVLGLQMTAKSIPAIIRFVLRKNARFVLTNRLNQDCLEQEFGKQRGSCGGNNNPDILHYAQNIDRFKDLDEIIKAPQTGNTFIEN